MFSKLVLSAVLLSSAMLVHADKVTEDLDVKAFKGLELSGASSVTYIRGEPQRVTVTIERDYLPRVQADVSRRGRLELDVHEKGWFGGSAVGDFVVTAPTLDFIELSGSGSLHGDRLDTDEVRIELNGSGDIRFDEVNGRLVRVELAGSGDVELNNLTAVTVRAEIMGSGDIAVSGAAAKAVVEIIGSGDFDGRELDTEVTRGEVIGSGDIVVKSAASANFETIGSGRGKVLKERP